MKISDNGRYLVQDDGSPWFYLADTGWTIAQRLNREEVERYLQDRADKGFNAIQVMGISEFDGLTAPNPYGAVPFENLDPTRPNDAYFRHLDYVVERAAARGMWTVLLPTWADKVGPKLWGTDPEVFTPENAEPYGRYLGERYRDAQVIWCLGGDRNPTAPQHFATWRAMAAGLDAGDGGRHLMTFHPQGRASSSTFFGADAWLDFNTIQSGHAYREGANYLMIAHDHGLRPAKPCLDSEPCYEDHPVRREDAPYFGDYEARRAGYWAVFAGACGHTYGANGVFQFWRGGPGETDKFGAHRPWTEALDLPGAGQMRHLRALMESRPVLSRIPDQVLLRGDAGVGADHTRATRADDGGYAFVYSATGQPFAVDMAKLSGGRVSVHWYDPRRGTARVIGEFGTDGPQTFMPPSSGRGADWVLTLDDATRGYAAPGSPQ